MHIHSGLCGVSGKRGTTHDKHAFLADVAPALETLKRRVTSGGLVSIMRSQFSRWPRHRSQQPKDRFVAEPSLKDIRDKAIFCVLLYSWCRVSALINLTVADYYERGGTRWLRFQEKRGKEHEVPVHFAGGGFAGVETIGSINDFLKEAIPYYPNLKPEMVRVVLVHPGEFVLPELGEELGRYTSRKLAERGVEIHPNTKVKGASVRVQRSRQCCNFRARCRRAAGLRHTDPIVTRRLYRIFRTAMPSMQLNKMGKACIACSIIARTRFF